ncbi:MAG: hypothetical protein QOI74_3771 [Micromonosporaceae bacterium]|nr:hypothetical protein [Micromonosporaceae bacterium]
MNPALTLSFVGLLVVAFLIDFSPVLRARAQHAAWTGHNRSIDEFTVVIPLYGDIRYLSNVDRIRRYGHRVLVSTTTTESPEFYRALGKLAARHGFQVLRTDVPRSRRYLCPALVKAGIDATGTPFVMRLDADTLPYGDLHQLFGAFITAGYDVASLRTLPSRHDTVLERLQDLEYSIAMDIRRGYPWLTSGAGYLGKTAVLRTVLATHTLFSYGEDIELGKLARMMRFRVGHIPFRLYTDVPATPWRWLRQRIVWAAGSFRHDVVNAHRYSWRHPSYFLYNTVILFLLSPLRWYSVIAVPWSVPLIVVAYWLFLFTVFWRRRSVILLLFPLYTLVQVMVLTPLGVVAYLATAARSRTVGLIRVRQRPVATPPVRAVAVRRYRDDDVAPSAALAASLEQYVPEEGGRRLVRNEETVAIADRRRPRPLNPRAPSR